MEEITPFLIFTPLTGVSEFRKTLPEIIKHSVSQSTHIPLKYNSGNDEFPHFMTFGIIVCLALMYGTRNSKISSPDLACYQPSHIFFIYLASLEKIIQV